MHELMACTASVLILSLFILQTAANTNTFIEAVYCERTISDYLSEEYDKDEMQDRMTEMKEKLEMMPGIKAELEGNRLDLYLEGVIGPANALGITDNCIHIEKKLELKEKAEENEEHDDFSGYPDDPDASEQDADGDERTDIIDDMTDTGEGDDDQ